MMTFLPESYIVKMVVIPLHYLHLCTHQNHVVWSVSRYGAHKPIGFHASFAIRCCSGIAIVDIDACIYYPHVNTWLVNIMAINIFWIWIWIWNLSLFVRGNQAGFVLYTVNGHIEIDNRNVSVLGNCEWAMLALKCTFGEEIGQADACPFKWLTWLSK